MIVQLFDGRYTSYALLKFRHCITPKLIYFSKKSDFAKIIILTDRARTPVLLIDSHYWLPTLLYHPCPSA